MEPLIVVAVCLGAFLLIVFSIFLLRRAEDDPLISRIDEFAAREEPASMEEIELLCRLPTAFLCRYCDASAVW